MFGKENEPDEDAPPVLAHTWLSACAAAPSLSALSMVGLILIALGTGGIKPCVAAFGGDQFLEHQVRVINASTYVYILYIIYHIIIIIDLFMSLFIDASFFPNHPNHGLRR